MIGYANAPSVYAPKNIVRCPVDYPPPPSEDDLDPFEFTDDELLAMDSGSPWVPDFEHPLDFESICKGSFKVQKIPPIYPSEFTAFAFYMPQANGKYGPFSFDERRHLIRPYNTPAKRVLLFCGRQVEKSTMLGNIAITYSCMITAHRTLYVSPSATQTRTFSVDRLKDPIETSPVLKQWTTKMLMQNVLEKQFVNRSKVTLRYAFLNADRCLSGSTRVHFADGSVATMEDLFVDSCKGPEGKFVGASLITMKIDDRCVPNFSTTQLVDVVSQGKREVFRVRLEGGTEVDMTDNEPLFTSDGWRQLREIRPGDFVAVPAKSPHGAGNVISDAEYRLVGYLLGDGHVVEFSNVGITNSNREVLDDFITCALSLGAELGDESIDKRSKNTTTRINIYGGRNGYKSRLRELDLIGMGPDTKRVPSEFFKGNGHQIREFLRAIYATDGWASVFQADSGLQAEIGYCSNSRGLLVDLKVLLTRFGINAIISRRKKPSTKKAKGAFVLSIRSRKHILRFIERIGIIGKRDALARLYDAIVGWEGKKDAFDRVAFSYERLRNYLSTKYGMSTHVAWTSYQIQLRPGNVKDSIGREVLRSIAAKLGDEFLMGLAESDVGWSRIESIESIGVQDTYDLTVGDTENFLVDGLIVHNTRGIPADKLLLDEFQDLIADHIPVIEQCTSHAREQYQSFCYAGTPKGLDNPLEYYRASLSTQGEWVVPCDRCGSKGAGRYWNILGEKNIGRKGLICARCGELIDPMHPDAQWAFAVPNPTQEFPFESYRIPQLMVPWVKWDEILLNYRRYPRDRFYNEVLGLSYDSGLRPLTMRHVMDECNPNVTMHPDELERIRTSMVGRDIFAGVDWGTGENSYTVLSMGYYEGMKFRIFFIHRFVGEDTDPEIQREKIYSILHAFSVRLLGADYGGGFDRNDFLVRKFGINRVHKFQYLPRPKKKIVWEPRLRRWMVHRTEVMSDVFNAIKRHQLEFPRWVEFKEPYAQDMLNIFSEYNVTLRMTQYNHRPDRPDDSFHSILLCFLASMLIYRRPDIVAPVKELNDISVAMSSWSPLDQG